MNRVYWHDATVKHDFKSDENSRDLMNNLYKLAERGYDCKDIVCKIGKGFEKLKQNQLEFMRMLFSTKSYKFVSACEELENVINKVNNTLY